MAQATTKQKSQADCPRCNGEGRLSFYNHILGGICFKCGGSGTVDASEVRRSKAARAKAAAERGLAAAMAQNTVAMILAELEARYGHSEFVQANNVTRERREEALIISYNKEHGTRFDLGNKKQFAAALCLR